MNRFVAVLIAVYVAELVARLADLPVDVLTWKPLGAGFAPWQWLTHLAVQGGGRGSALGVVFQMIMLWFLLPLLSSSLPRRALLEALGFGLAGGVVTAMAADATGWLIPAWNHGWSSLLFGLSLLVGHLRPDVRFLLFFVLPVDGRTIVWGSLAIGCLFVMAEPTLSTVAGVGTWLGTYAWTQLRGPGAHRRSLAKRGKAIEDELKRLQQRRRFEVLDGGRNRDDDLLN